MISKDTDERGSGQASSIAETDLTLPGLTRRGALRRKALLALDPVLGLANDLWLSAWPPYELGRQRREVDPESGRATKAALENSGISRSLEPLASRARDQRLSETQIDEALDAARPKAANAVAQSLVKHAPAMLRQHRARDRRLLRRMRAVWGEAFDSLYAGYVALEEFGANLQILYGATEDPLNQALLALHARSALVLAEVHSLCSEGFPHGAHARARTLYETSVMASVLSQHGRRADTSDLANRFLEHPVAEQKHDLDRLVQVGREVPAEDLSTVNARLDSLVERYGPMFRKENGWAHPLFPQLGPKGRITFAMLDSQATDRFLDRADYRMAGHHVHSSAWTIVLNEYDRGGQTVRLTGSTNIGFAEPARVALAAGQDSATALLHGLQPKPDQVHGIMLDSLEQLAERTLHLLDEAESYIESREARLAADGNARP